MEIKIELPAVPPTQTQPNQPMLTDRKICGISRDFLGCVGFLSAFGLGFLVALPVGLAPTSEGDEQRKIAATVIGSIAIALLCCSIYMCPKEKGPVPVEYDPRPGDLDYDGRFG